MSYEINLKVNKNGKLEPPSKDEVLTISVFKESKRVKLLFTVDEEIDDEYHYLKFTNARTSYLYRVHNNEFEIPKAVTAYEGVWELSFICCDEPANSDNTITADYIYASELLACVIKRGNLGIVSSTEEQRLIKQIVEGTFDSFTIPNTCSYITSYFLNNYTQEFGLYIPASVTLIKDHICYNSGCTSITFEEGSSLTTLEDYALYRIFNVRSIVFPKSLSSWGKYNCGYCGFEDISFEANSNLRSLTSYAFWNCTGLKRLTLPDKLLSFTGNTNVIKDCSALEEIWFPNTITTAIPQNAIAGCDSLTNIHLQTSFNISANFSNCTNLSRESIVNIFNSLKDLTAAGLASKALVLGSTNLAKVTEEEQNIALNKGWSLA
ncbi:MAG: leucine-rich repeat domain-containing protein [Bacilli bacterium]|jgi:hypothetical protein|nr:leucine-rich repeat domain-containing protein [Bacilli bacterium]